MPDEKEKLTPGVGLDVGTMNLVSSRFTDKEKKINRRMRDAFLNIPLTSRKHLRMSKVSFIEDGGDLIVLGDAALELANVFVKDVRRPLAKGLIAAGETDAQRVLAYLIRAVVQVSPDQSPVVPGERCYYSVPANPIDSPDQDVVYHTEVFRGLLANLGFTPTPCNEALAIVYSECAKDNFSGLAISFGSGMMNCALAYQTMDVLSFALSQGGDWVDTRAAKALGMTPSKVCAVKEVGVDLLAPKNDVQRAIALYIRTLMTTAIETVAEQVQRARRRIEIPAPIPIVVSGGTTLAVNFLEVFRQEFEKHKGSFPIPISEVRMAANPMTAVADGLLVMASQDDE